MYVYVQKMSDNGVFLFFMVDVALHRCLDHITAVCNFAELRPD